MPKVSREKYEILHKYIWHQLLDSDEKSISFQYMKKLITRILEVDGDRSDTFKKQIIKMESLEMIKVSRGRVIPCDPYTNYDTTYERAKNYVKIREKERKKDR
jgi:hypothetical protein